VDFNNISILLIVYLRIAIDLFEMKELLVPREETVFIPEFSFSSFFFFETQTLKEGSFKERDTKNRNENKQRSERKISYSKRETTVLHQFNRFLPFLFLVPLLFWCSSFSFASSSSLTWKNDTSYPLEIQISVALTGQDHCIYMFGGYSSNNAPVSDSYKFNITAGSPREWTEIASMPTRVNFATGCVANDRRFFIFGGGSTAIQIYNATDNSWSTTVPSMPSGASIADYYMSCAVDSSSGLMYITGGSSDGTRFYSYHVNSNTITDLSTSSPPSPFNLSNQGSFVNNDKLYVFGGLEDDKLESSLAATFIYDIVNSSWSTGRNMTQATGGFGYATDGSRFYAIGGYDNFGGVIEYTQIYDISSGNWSIDNGIVYPGGIEGNAVVFLDGSLHSIGGYGDNALSIHRIATLCGVYAFSGPCDDENSCTFNDTCQSNGQCSVGSNITCPSPSNPCQSNVCNSTWGCAISTGTSCSSINKCLLNTTCSNGECTGQSKQCMDSTCDASTGECVSNSSSISSSILSSVFVGIMIVLLH